MENNFKRFLSLALALLMIVSMMPQIAIGASAAQANSTVALPGSFNDWNQSNWMKQGEGSNVTYVMYLSAGTYEFKIKNGDAWLGNSGTIEDTTTTTSTDGWDMSASESTNCKLQATGGTYTFTFNTDTNKLVVTHLVPAEASGNTVRLYFDNSTNNWDNVSVYCWDKDIEYLFTGVPANTWPGTAMTKIEKHQYLVC